MRIISIVFLGISILFTVNVASQQHDINDYKYMIVPESYSFLTKKDKYQLNSLTRFLFKKHGFTAFNLAEGYPEDLKRNGCKALRVDLKKNSTFLYTKLVIELTDCNGKVVYTSSEGRSKEKEYKIAYQQALRDVFNDPIFKRYKYNGKSDRSDNVSNSGVIIPSTKQVIESEKNSTAVVNDYYIFNEEKYLFNKQSYGFEIIKNLTPIGKIIKASRDNTYIVSSTSFNGYGFYNSVGNFVIESVNPVTNELDTKIFVVN